MGPDELRTIGSLMHRVLESGGSERVLAEVGAEVRALCETFPLYPDLDRGYSAAWEVDPGL